MPAVRERAHSLFSDGLGGCNLLLTELLEPAMPVILGFLGSIATILVLLRQLAEAGIDLGGLNPFLWKRR